MRFAELDSSYDVIVVGARCAGAATAMLLARRGLKVAALDRTAHGSDTLSTHALMRGAVLQLHRWGVLHAVRATGTPAIRRTVFHYGSELVDVAIKPRDGIDSLLAPRRTVLDAVLADAAVESGVDVVRGVRVRDLVREEEGRVSGVVAEDPSGTQLALRASLVIGADGRRSLVARQAGAETMRTGRHHTGVIYGYWDGLPQDGYHWYYESGASAGIIPTNDGLTCVFASMPPERFQGVRGDLEAGYLEVLAEAAPEVATAVGGARRVGNLFGFPGVPGFLRRSHGPGWALVGDAGYFKDPLTAHGITDALRDAELLADAVAEDTDEALAAYQVRRDELSETFFETTDRVASFQWDLPTVQALHLTMTKEMHREVQFLRELDAGRSHEERTGRAA
jgi:2-polyprenyl-6-methoxyphenol hydroxylase-like FAD-dependent oxidoreductase